MSQRYRYFKDEHGISHIKFTTWQGIEFLARGITVPPAIWNGEK